MTWVYVFTIVWMNRNERILCTIISLQLNIFVFLGNFFVFGCNMRIECCTFLCCMILWGLKFYCYKTHLHSLEAQSLHFFISNNIFDVQNVFEDDKLTSLTTYKLQIAAAENGWRYKISNKNSVQSNVKLKTDGGHGTDDSYPIETKLVHTTLKMGKLYCGEWVTILLTLLWIVLDGRKVLHRCVHMLSSRNDLTSRTCRLHFCDSLGGNSRGSAHIFQVRSGFRMSFTADTVRYGSGYVPTFLIKTQNFRTWKKWNINSNFGQNFGFWIKILWKNI